MMNRLEKKEWGILGTAALIGLIILFIMYFIFARPAANDLAMLENNLSAEQKLLAAFEETKEKAGPGENDAITLQQKIPVKPFQEQIVLDIERAETTSGSLLLNARFGMPGSEGEEAVQPQAEEGQEGAAPEGLKPIDTVLELEAEDYYELEDFLKRVEQQQRHTQIVSLSFEGHKEVMTLAEEQQSLVYSVMIRNYYYPSLEGAFEMGPSFHAPQPAFKDNPLASGMAPAEPAEDGENTVGRVEDNETTGTPAEQQDPPQQAAASSLTHTVEQGETLYSISIKYFNNRSGTDAIKEHNNLNGEKIYAGQTLTIPIH